MATEHIQLSTLEKEVILRLSEFGPMSGYDFHLGGERERRNRKALMSSGHWRTVLDHIGPKGLNLICLSELPHSDASDRRGRRRDLYWLTDKGVLLALCYNAPTKCLMENVKKVYHDSSHLCFVIELKEALGEKIFDFAFSGALKLRDFSDESLNRFIIQGLMHSFMRARELSPTSDPKALKTKLQSILRKYPELLSLQNCIVKKAQKEMSVYFSDW